MEDIVFVSKSTQDFRAWLKTIIVSFIPFIVFCILVFVCDVKFIIFMLILWTAIIGGGILYSPNKYMVSNTNLIIKRYLGNIKIPLEEIQDIRIFTEQDKKGLLGIYRAEGAFGNFGLYCTNIHKKLHVYTRRDSNWTLIVTSRKKYVIAPNDIYLIDVIQDKIIYNIINSKFKILQQ
jgi:hypothetical protein